MSTNLKALERRFARHGADISRRTAGSYATFEDGTVAPWIIQWGSRRLPCLTLADAKAFLDRIEGKDA